MGKFAMQTDGRGTFVDSSFYTGLSGSTSTGSRMNIKPPIEWDWDLEHEDRRVEAHADAAMHSFQPFQVDRKLLKDVVREKMGTEVGRIKFLSSGMCNQTSFGGIWPLAFDVLRLS